MKEASACRNHVEPYDMDSDRYETKNRAEEHPEIVRELKTKLVTWRTYLPELTPDRANPVRK